MKLIKIVEQKRFVDIQVNPIITEVIERNVLKKKGKLSLRMRQADKMNFIQGEVIDIRDERKAQRNAERNAKRKCYKY
jgi:hypothetical protein